MSGHAKSSQVKTSHVKASRVESNQFNKINSINEVLLLCLKARGAPPAHTNRNPTQPKTTQP